MERQTEKQKQIEYEKKTNGKYNLKLEQQKRNERIFVIII